MIQMYWPINLGHFIMHVPREMFFQEETITLACISRPHIIEFLFMLSHDSKLRRGIFKT